jgi:hypothetical protein
LALPDPVAGGQALWTVGIRANDIRIRSVACRAVREHFTAPTVDECKVEQRSVVCIERRVCVGVEPGVDGGCAVDRGGDVAGVVIGSNAIHHNGVALGRRDGEPASGER